MRCHDFHGQDNGVRFMFLQHSSYQTVSELDNQISYHDRKVRCSGNSCCHSVSEIEETTRTEYPVFTAVQSLVDQCPADDPNTDINLACLLYKEGPLRRTPPSSSSSDTTATSHTTTPSVTTGVSLIAECKPRE